MAATTTRRTTGAVTRRKHATAARMQQAMGEIVKVNYEPRMVFDFAGDDSEGHLYAAYLRWAGGDDTEFIEFDDRRPEPVEMQLWQWLMGLSLRLEYAASKLAEEMRANGQGRWVEDYYAGEVDEEAAEVAAVG